MRLAEALALSNRKVEGDQKRRIFLVCGMQPLHLVTFLEAHFAERFPNLAAEIETGIYGDLDGNLAKAAGSEAQSAVAVVEWSDIDPRLGLRSSGGWMPSIQEDIIKNCRESFARLLKGLEHLASKMPVALVALTLPNRLLGHTAGWQASRIELELESQATSFLSNAAMISGVGVANPSRLGMLSPQAERADPLLDMNAGFPYTTAHASAVAEQAIKLLFPPSPMKGLITDLDETFWSGIVGEIGSGGVCWGLAAHAQIHALYQQMLLHLSGMGVLLAIASKNDASVVEAALKREDLLIPGASFFPVCVNWGPKSQSIATILKTWNIGADSVVFVDDSPMELDEVRTAFPAMTCLQFQTKKPAQVVALLAQLRDLFGKPSILPEDALRQASIRANALVQAGLEGSANGEFVRGLQGRVSFDCRKDPQNKRLLELINKTNQFNLNGLRVTEGDWLRHLSDKDSVVVGVSYEDKFGPLGTIGVLAGRQVNGQVEVQNWVLSCRAFSRRIEDHMLAYLFDERQASTVRFAFRRTDRNQPVQTHLESLGLPVDSDGDLLLSENQFHGHVTGLPHHTRFENHE